MKPKANAKVLHATAVPSSHALGLRVPSWISIASPLQVSLLLLVVTLALRVFSYGATGLDWDESLYIVQAQRWLMGGLPYVAVWDQHPIGMPALFALVGLIMSDGLLAARISCTLAVTATSVVLYLFLARGAGSPWAGLLAALLYISYMARPEGIVANTEIFNNLIVTLSSYLLFRAVIERKLHGRLVFAVAVLLGIGLQIKYVILPEAAALCVMALLAAWLDGASLARVVRLACVAMIGGLLATACAVVYFWSAGALQPYLDANLRANLTYLDQLPLTFTALLAHLRAGLLPFVALMVWPVVLAFQMRDQVVRRKYGLAFVWLIVWLVATCIDIALPLKFWKHYFNALVPPLCLLAGLSVTLLFQHVGTRLGWLLGTAVVATFAPAFAILVKDAPYTRTIWHPNVPLAIADRIKSDGTNGQDVYVFNYDPLIYAYAAARPPTRFVLTAELADMHGSSGASPAGEISRILRSRPRWIVVADPSPYDFGPDVWQALHSSLTSYRLTASFVEVDYGKPLPRGDRFDPITIRLYGASDD